ncbi:hypothetical protein [Bacillus manliponensis]|uniref:hypothetical protein n=1 Tax=Bacillus manliponensis TaxID=574376 RepID=UPI00068A830A|nr:hypothetical protein [Bacillus manliponensis]
MKRNKVLSIFLSLGLAFLVGLSAISFPTGANAEVKGGNSGTYYKPPTSADSIFFETSKKDGKIVYTDTKVMKYAK